ncbi:hypothetical protein BKA80DRAFT_275971 [Phyllosticta citrichinensis]
MNFLLEKCWYQLLLFTHNVHLYLHIHDAELESQLPASRIPKSIAILDSPRYYNPQSRQRPGPTALRLSLLDQSSHHQETQRPLKSCRANHGRPRNAHPPRAPATLDPLLAVLPLRPLLPLSPARKRRPNPAEPPPDLPSRIPPLLPALRALLDAPRPRRHVGACRDRLGAAAAVGATVGLSRVRRRGPLLG